MASTLVVAAALLCGCDDGPSGPAGRADDPSLSDAADDARSDDVLSTDPDGVDVDAAPDVDELWPDSDRAASIRAALLAGIDRLDPDGALLSALVVTGADAVPVVVDSVGSPTIAAAEVGSGRVVVIAHEGVLTSNAPGFARLVRNTSEWLARSPQRPPAVAWGPGMAEAAERLTTGTLVGERVPSLVEADIFVTTAYVEWTDEERAAISLFVEQGGGLLVAGHAWWWGMSGGTDAAKNFPGNRLLAPWGITISTRWAEGGAMPLPAQEANDLHHAARALRALLDDAGGSGAPLSDPERRTAAWSAGTAVDELPMQGLFWEQATRISASVGAVVPPVAPNNEPLRALALRVQLREALDAPADAVRAHPAADAFPGTTDAPRTRRTVEVATGYRGYDERFAFSAPLIPRWHGTGAWAPAGGVVAVRVPAAWVGRGFAIQIGAHTDLLWALPQWERMPRMVRHHTITEETFSIASGLGGPIYVLEPAGSEVGAWEVELDGVVPMARFVAGQDSDGIWNETDWSVHAPWAELENGAIVFTVPAADARTVTQPEALLALWDEVMEGAAWLAGLRLPRTRAERFVVDRQIAAGWMHSGYPIMAHLESAQEVVSLPSLRSDGAWGPFHEIGHNHQNIDWVLPGTEESNVNLWSVWVSEEVIGISRAEAHPELASAARQRRIDAWKSGRDRDWSVWMALETYLQIEEAFGWEPYAAVFGAYLQQTSAQRPANDAARAQEWVVQISRATGRDLSDFHAAWGFDIAPTTRAQLADLPAWDEHPMR